MKKEIRKLIALRLSGVIFMIVGGIIAIYALNDKVFNGEELLAIFLFVLGIILIWKDL